MAQWQSMSLACKRLEILGNLLQRVTLVLFTPVAWIGPHLKAVLRDLRTATYGTLPNLAESLRAKDNFFLHHVPHLVTKHDKRIAKGPQRREESGKNGL